MRNAEVIRQWKILKRIEKSRYITAKDLAEVGEQLREARYRPRPVSRFKRRAGLRAGVSVGGVSGPPKKVPGTISPEREMEPGTLPLLCRVQQRDAHWPTELRQRARLNDFVHERPVGHSHVVPRHARTEL